jgi:hypothetical protein
LARWVDAAQTVDWNAVSPDVNVFSSALPLKYSKRFSIKSIRNGSRPSGLACPQKLRQFESIRELQHAIAGGIDVIHRAVPIDGILQLRFPDGVGNPRHLAYPDGTADADDAGVHDPILGAARMMALLPVLKFLHPTGMAIDGGQDLHQRRIKVREAMARSLKCGSTRSMPTTPSNTSVRNKESASTPFATSAICYGTRWCSAPRIAPTGHCDEESIIQFWNDILRFIATIKLKETTASDIFRRLNSYSKQHGCIMP